MRAQRMQYGIACGLLVMASGTALAQDDAREGRGNATQKVRKAFEITVRDRGNPLDPVLAVAGVLTLNLRTSDGRFVGRITPGFSVP